MRRLLKKADQTTKNEVERLLNNKYIVKSVRQELTYRDIDSSINNIWSVLYSTGYLTQCGRLPGKQLKLIIPNKEVHELFTDLVKNGFRKKLSQILQRFIDSAKHFLQEKLILFRICSMITCGIPSAFGTQRSGWTEKKTFIMV